MTWNRDLPAVRNSTGGNIEILDGGQSREVALDSAQVAQAVIYYTRTSDDVTFRLNIRRQGSAPVSGIARILAGRKTGAPVSATNVPSPVPPAASAGDNGGVEAARHLPRTSLNPEPAFSRSPRSSPAPAQISQSFTAVPNPPASRIVPETKQSAPPKVTPTAETTESKKPADTASPAPAVSPAGSSQPGATGAPVTAAAPQVINAQPAARPPTAGSIASPAGRGEAPRATPPPVSATSAPAELPIPPRPVRKIAPLRHSGLEPVLEAPVTVTVEVSIDSQGRVVEAQARPNSSKYWSDKAVEAARQWRFQPARLHGQSVPSVSTIDFRFNP